MTNAAVSLVRVETGIPGCLVVTSTVHADARGGFAKPFAASAFRAAGLRHDWAECFWSVSKRGVVRGFHVQLPPADHAKLLWVVAGASQSAVIDLRAGSPAYGRAECARLDAAGGRALYVPAGVAHGFQALEDATTIVYLVTSAHDAAHDSGVRWDSAAVEWPIPVTEVSARDNALVPLESFNTPFRFEP